MANSGDNSGDEFSSAIIPNCLGTASHEEMFSSCPFSSGKKVFFDDIQSSSSTEIPIITLPESSDDEYHTPPDHHSSSQTSSNLPPTNTSAADLAPMKTVDLTNETENLGFPEKSHGVFAGKNTHTINKSANHQLDSAKPVTEDLKESTHQVFVKMPQREQETSNREKRKLPISMTTQKQDSSSSSKQVPFTSLVDHLLKMVERKDGGGDDEGDIDFVETAKMRGLILPGPRWWPAEGFED